MNKRKKNKKQKERNNKKEIHKKGRIKNEKNQHEGKRNNINCISNTPSSYFDDQEFYNMVFGTESYYWLATRYVNCSLINAAFGLCYVTYSGLGGNYMFNSYGDTNYTRRYLRPVVSLGSDIQITPVENADGSTPSNMHQISK